MRKSGILIFTLLIIALAGCSKKDRLGDFVENHYPEKSYFLYPSTLRMVNLENNQDFNDMIKDLVKARYYSYPKETAISDELKSLKKQLLEDGYVEIFNIKNKEITADVYVLEQKTPLVLAFIKNANTINLLEIEGMINPMKIPKLMETFNEDQFLNLFEITNNDRKGKHIEHSENKQPE